MAHQMHLWISEMDYMLFSGFLERLKADCLPPSFIHDEADGQLIHQQPRVF
jgi:hypothetical protein